MNELNIFHNEKESTIVLSVDKERIDLEWLQEWNSTGSFKRYFEMNTTENKIAISTSFSKKQLTSRYMQDYMIHLVQQMLPISLNLKCHELQKAA